MKSFSQRVLESELMDNPDLSPELHRPALRGLGRVNSLSRTVGFLSRRIISENLVPQKSKLRILDLACGGGDVSCGIARNLTRAGIDAHVEGWDMIETAVDYAEQNIPEDLQGKLKFRALNVFDADANDSDLNSFDIVLCTLFLHHLDKDDAVRLLKKMFVLTTSFVMIDDLRRSRLGWCLAQVGCRILTRSPIVHSDGPMSVKAAFVESEVNELAELAGLAQPVIVRHWPERFLATWRKAA